jgi:type I restriction enzyme M protein
VVKAWVKRKLNDEGRMTNGGIVWKAVEKSAVLETKDATLVAERFLGVAENDSEHHPMIALGDDELFRLESGSTPSTTKPEYWDGPHAWATLVDLPAEDFVTNLTRTERTITDAGLKNSSAVLLPVGSIIVSTRATLGRVAVARIPVATNQGFKNIIIKDASRALPEYVALAVTRLRAQMLEFASGGTFKEISKANFSLLEIPLPPLEEQRRIVAEIEGYQKVLDGARQILAGYRPRLDIDPEWESVKLEDVTDADCSLSYGIVQPGDEFPGGLPVVRPVDLTTNLIRLDGLKRINPKLADGYKRSTLKGGELLLCVRGTTGVVSIAALELAGANVTRGIVPVRFNSSVMLSQFGFYAICSESVQSQIRAKTYGAALQQINIGDLRELEIPMPPLPEQRRLVSALDAEAAQMETVRALLPRFEAKIQRVLDRVWGTSAQATE